MGLAALELVAIEQCDFYTDDSGLFRVHLGLDTGVGADFNKQTIVSDSLCMFSRANNTQSREKQTKTKKVRRKLRKMTGNMH